MAWLEKRAGRFRIKFRFGGQNFQHTLKETTEREANAVLGRLEDNLMLLERGRLEIPPDADVALFLVSDGRLNQKPTLQRVLRLKEFSASTKSGRSRRRSPRPATPKTFTSPTS